MKSGAVLLKRKIKDEKRRLLQFVDEPIFIAEFGLKGPEDYPTRCLKDAANTIKVNIPIAGANYVNITDVPYA